MAYVFLGIGLVLGVVVFRLCISMDWHWALGVFFGLVPVALTLLVYTPYGVLVAAVFVAGMYRAASKSR